MFKLKKEATEYENKSLRLPKDLIDEVQALANKNNLSFNHFSCLAMLFCSVYIKLF